MLDTWLNAIETGRTEAFDALGRQLEQARARHEGAKALDEALFGADFLVRMQAPDQSFYSSISQPENNNLMQPEWWKRSATA